MSEQPVVKVWKKLASGWGQVAVIRTWESLECEPRHLQEGDWSLRMPYDAQAAKITRQRLVTVDYRGRMMTGIVKTIRPHSDPETGQPMLEVEGRDALELLSYVTAWPVPANLIDNQTSEYYIATGIGETVLRTLINANLVTRRGDDVVLPASQGRGGSINVRARFDNLLELVALKAERAGLGVSVGLAETTSSTRAEFRVEFYVPADKSARVKLSHKVGTLRDWQQSDEAPTATTAIVGGAGEGTGRVFRTVTDAAAEAAWFWKRESFLDARDTFDTVELDERGQELLDDSAAQSSFTMETADAEGMRYGTHYGLGDKVTVELLTGVSEVGIVSAVKLQGSLESGYTISPKVGDPDGSDPLMSTAAIVAGMRRRVRRLEQRR